MTGYRRSRNAIEDEHDELRKFDLTTHVTIASVGFGALLAIVLIKFFFT